LEYLEKQQTASVRELSHALAMTGANIRHHLAVLESNYLIEPLSQRREGQGRPETIYGLSRHVLGEGLAELACAMLNVWLKNTTETALETDLRSVASKMGGDDLPDPSLLLTHRLRRLVDRLNELHYQSRWEAGLNGPNVILGHCPYVAIVASNPELCRMDAYLLEQWTGLPVEQTAMLQKSIKGVPYCGFRVTGTWEKSV
jgi:predicted ArsR family transcriptional regulator